MNSHEILCVKMVFSKTRSRGARGSFWGGLSGLLRSAMGTLGRNLFLCNLRTKSFYELSTEKANKSSLLNHSSPVPPEPPSSLEWWAVAL